MRSVDRPRLVGTEKVRALGIGEGVEVLADPPLAADSQTDPFATVVGLRPGEPDRQGDQGAHERRVFMVERESPALPMADAGWQVRKLIDRGRVLNWGPRASAVKSTASPAKSERS